MAGWWGDGASLGFQGQNLTNVYGDRAVLTAQGLSSGTTGWMTPWGVMVMLVRAHTRTPQHGSSASGPFPECHAFKVFPWIWASFLYSRASLLPPSCLSLNFLFLLIDSGFSLVHFSSSRDLGLLVPDTLARLGNHFPLKQLSFSFLKINFYKSIASLQCCVTFRSTYTYILSLSDYFPI